MRNTTTTVSRGAMPDTLVERARWIEFLDEFTRENRGAHARLEILGSDIGDQIEADDRSFDGIAADVKDGEDAVSITFASDDHLTHFIPNATAIWVRRPAGPSGAAVLVVAGNGNKTLLELSRPEDYELPSGEPEKRSAKLKK